MKNLMVFVVLFCANLMFISAATAQCSGGKAVKTSHQETETDIIDIAISSPDHTTLVAAVKAAGLVETLQGKGPFTVFAPTNAAFAKLPAGTVENLLQPKNKAALAGVLTYHVIAGNFMASDVIGAIKANGGTAVFSTVNGAKLKASLAGSSVVLEDENGGRSVVTAVDLKGSNGVVHVIDTVVLPQ